MIVAMIICILVGCAGFVFLMYAYFKGWLHNPAMVSNAVIVAISSFALLYAAHWAYNMHELQVLIGR